MNILNSKGKIIAGVLILSIALVCVFVGGNNQQTQADTIDSAVTINLKYSEIKELFSMVLESKGEVGNLGASSGYAHMQKESFLQGLAIGGRDQFNTNNLGQLITQLVLYNTATAPTGVEGGLYYDTDDSNIKLYDGASWFTVGTTTEGIAKSADRLSFDSLNYYMTLGTTTQSALSILTVEATSTAAIPLTLRGYTAQTANLFQIHDVAGSELFAIDASGNASTTMISTGALWASGATTLASTLTVSGNTAIDGGTFVFNDSSADVDFRFEGNGNANLLYGDAGNDRLGVGTSTPTNIFHVEDSTATSTVTVSSGSASSGGRIILEDSDAGGCSEIYILDGTITSATIACPTGI